MYRHQCIPPHGMPSGAWSLECDGGKADADGHKQGLFTGLLRGDLTRPAVLAILALNTDTRISVWLLFTVKACIW